MGKVLEEIEGYQIKLSCKCGVYVWQIAAGNKQGNQIEYHASFQQVLNGEGE